MNREDIIRMAREAGFEELFKDSHDWVCFTEEIERFAALVAAAEREKQAEAFQQILTATQNEAQAAEREACAKVCEAEADATDAHLHICIDALRDCADTIRSRGQA